MILPLEQQVANLALSKELKELGFPQETYFHWIFRRRLVGRKTKGIIVEPVWVLDCCRYGITEESIAAPTAAELGEILPKGIKTWKGFNPWQKFEWWCNNRDMPFKTLLEGAENTYQADGNTEVNAKTKMLIHLAKQGLVKFEKESVR